MPENLCFDKESTGGVLSISQKELRMRNIEKVGIAILTVVLIFLLGMNVIAFAASQNTDQKTDFIIINANVITADAGQPRAEAVAIKGNKIIAVGKTKDIKKYATKSTNVIDASGKTVTAGYNDSHMHPLPTFPFKSGVYIVNLFEKTSMQDLIASLKEKAAITPAGQWIIGSGYQDTKLGKWPTAADLDQVSTQHPISIVHSSAHASSVNSFCLQKADVSPKTQDPPGGVIDRDSSGNATGVLREAAATWVTDRVVAGGFPMPTASEQDILDGMEVTLNNYAKVGLTSIGANANLGVPPVSSGMSLLDTAPTIGIYQKLLGEGRLPVRVNFLTFAYPAIGSTLSTEDQLIAKGWRTGKYLDDQKMLRVGPLKLFAGNSLSGRTCWLKEPYTITPAGKTPPYYGIPYKNAAWQVDLTSPEGRAALNQRVTAAHKAGFQWALHSNGDQDIEYVLDAYEAAQKAKPNPSLRHRIEHSSVTNDLLLTRMKKIGVIPVFHEYTWEHGDKYSEYGEARIAWIHAYRSAIDKGIRPGHHSDSPVSDINPFVHIQTMVTRTTKEGVVRGANQAITAKEAVFVATANGAYISNEDKFKGMIKKGYLADLVILDRDPTAINPADIKNTVVEKTIVGGRVVYSKQ
jgi:predicted amidohydrolase YtcJ